MIKQTRSAFFCCLFALVFAGVGCADDNGSGGNDCGPNEIHNPIQDICEPEIRSDDGGRNDSGRMDSGTEDAGGGDVDASSDTVEDTADEDAQTDSGNDGGGGDSGGCPDNDNDGYRAQRCGGDDCDDTNASINPGLSEICDELDNDCSGQVNDGRTCAFYAHTSSDLYLVDPFNKTASPVTSVPGFFDVDTHPNGTLYGISPSTLFRFDETNSDWIAVGSTGGVSPNGLAIDTQGTAYMTAGNNVYTLDLTTGGSTLIGSMGNGFTSSGDCVINKDDTLYMSSSHPLQGDALILIDTTDASGRNIGQTSFSEIYGLTAAWGRLYGMTGAGQLIEIDSGNGQAQLIHTFAGKSWYGAASTPNR